MRPCTWSRLRCTSSSCRSEPRISAASQVNRVRALPSVGREPVGRLAQRAAHAGRQVGIGFSARIATDDRDGGGRVLPGAGQPGGERVDDRASGGQRPEDDGRRAGLLVQGASQGVAQGECHGRIAGQDRAPVPAVGAGERREHGTRVLDVVEQDHGTDGRPRRVAGQQRPGPQIGRRVARCERPGRSGRQRRVTAHGKRTELVGDRGDRPSPVGRLDRGATASSGRTVPPRRTTRRCRRRPPPP